MTSQEVKRLIDEAVAPHVVRAMVATALARHTALPKSIADDPDPKAHPFLAELEAVVELMGAERTDIEARRKAAAIVRRTRPDLVPDERDVQAIVETPVPSGPGTKPPKPTKAAEDGKPTTFAGARDLVIARDTLPLRVTSDGAGTLIGDPKQIAKLNDTIAQEFPEVVNAECEIYEEPEEEPEVVSHAEVINMGDQYEKLVGAELQKRGIRDPRGGLTVSREELARFNEVVEFVAATNPHLMRVVCAA